MVLDNTSPSHTERSERSERSGVHLSLTIPIILYGILLNKIERKLVKLNMKAQECVSHDKAIKILKKAEKAYEKARIVKEG